MFEDVIPKLNKKISEKVNTFHSYLERYDFKLVFIYLFRKENFDIFTKDGFLKDDAYLMSYTADSFLSIEKSKRGKELPGKEVVEQIVEDIAEIVKTYMMRLSISEHSNGLSSSIKIDSMFVERSFFQIIEIEILNAILKPAEDYFLQLAKFNPLDVIKFKDGLMVYIVEKMNSAKNYEDFYKCLDIDCPSVASLSGISLFAVENIVEYFKLKKSDNTSFLPRRKNLVVYKPILEIDDQSICVNPINLIKKLRQNVEETLKENKVYWSKYCKSRASILENETVNTLRNIFQYADIHQNIKYKLNDDPALYESDILINVDQFLILIECKSANLSEPAKYGYKERLDKDVKEIIHNAHSQCKRTLQYISSAESVNFTANDGELIIKRGSYQKIYLMSISLDNLELITANIHKILLLPTETVVVTLSLYDLKVICDLLRNPSEFLLYLDRRARSISERKIHAHDELDIFTTFLHNGLLFRDEEKFDMIDITNFSDEVDQYYIKNRKPKKPQLKTFFQTTQKIVEIERLHLSGWLALSKELLSYSGIAQQNIWKNVEKIVKKAKKKGSSDFSIFEDENKTGLTFYSTKVEKKDMIPMLQSYIDNKFYETGMRYWFLIIFLNNSKKIDKYYLYVNKNFF